MVIPLTGVTQDGAKSAKERHQSFLTTRIAVVHKVWGVAINDAIPDAYNLRRPGQTSLGNNYIIALAALAETEPNFSVAQQLMKEQRDGRVAREVDKQGRQAPHLTVNDLQEIIQVPAKKQEEEDRMGVQKAFGLRKVRKPSLKAAEIAEVNKRQKTHVVDPGNAVNNEQRSASVKPAGDNPAELHVQETDNDRASATALGQTEHNVNVEAGDLPQPLAPPGEEDLDVGDLLAQYGLLDTDERSLIIGLLIYSHAPDEPSHLHRRSR